MAKGKTAVKAVEVTQAAKTETAKYTEKEAEHAKQIMQACDAAESASAGLFNVILQATLNGCTFEGIETAQPELKKRGSYRSAKAVIKGSLSHSIPLLNNGKARSKGDLAKALATKTKAEDDGTDSGKVEKGAPRKATPAEVIKAGLAHLKADAKMRAKFAAQILELAAMLAKETKKAA